MNNWNCDTWPAQFLNSEYAFFIAGDLEAHAESILSYCIQQWTLFNPRFPENWTSSLVVALLNEKLPQLNLPVATLKKCPDLIEDFFNFLGSSGIYPPATNWVLDVQNEKAAFLSRFRADGSIKGQTQLNAEQKINRNDSCPCGSGKKFKKCCGK